MWPLQGESGPPDVVSFADVRRLALDSIPPRAGLSKAMGLAKLVAVLLGKRLDKSQQVRTLPIVQVQVLNVAAKQPRSEGQGRLAPQPDNLVQVSSWGTRPLTEEQLAYAGADAQVLTALLDAIVTEVAQVSALLVPAWPGSPSPLRARLSDQLQEGTIACRPWHSLLLSAGCGVGVGSSVS